MTNYVQSCISFDSYIKPQPDLAAPGPAEGCISFDSYIKPQPPESRTFQGTGCISFDSYIKPQRCEECRDARKVVYLLIPTSNHNVAVSQRTVSMLYIF